jgi:YidC/Oxa1 family membrane protein insertase
MKRNDIIIVLILILSVFLYPSFDRKFIAPLFPAKPAPAPAPAAPAPAVPATSEAAVTPPTAPVPAPSVTNTPARVEIPEQFVNLRNSLVDLRLTNRGGAVVSATFTNYTARLEQESGPLTWDFSEETTVAYQGLEGISANNGLELSPSADGRSATFTGVTATGIRFTREISLSDRNYYVTIKDTFANPGATQVVLPDHSIRLGRIHQLDKVSEIMPTLGVDISHLEGEGVRHYSSKVAGWAEDAGRNNWHTEKIRISPTGSPSKTSSSPSSSSCGRNRSSIPLTSGFWPRPTARRPTASLWTPTSNSCPSIPAPASSAR